MKTFGLMFNISYANSVKKDIKDIPSNTLLKIKNEIENLIYFPNINNIKKLNSHPLADFRLRVGNYRVLFDVESEKKEIYILKISHRKDIY